MDPENIVTFELGAGQKKDFFANVTMPGCYLMGAYIVSDTEKSKVTMTVYSPDERILLTKSETNEAAFKSSKPAVGLYRISFSNKNVSSSF